MNCSRKYGVTSAIVFCCFLLLPHECFAVANCTTPPTCTDNGGNIGSISTFDPAFTRLRMAPSTDFDVWVDYDTSIGRLPHLIWQDVTLGDAGFASNINVRFIGRDLSTLQTNVDRTLEVSKLTMYKTDLDTGVKLSFAGNDNQINLSDSGIYFTNQQPGFISTAPLTINSVSGSNYLKGFTGEHKPTSTTINVQAGSTLLFDYSGSLSNTALNRERLYFATPVTGSVDNANLSLRYSNVYFNSTSFAFTNNSTLSLSGADTKVEFDNVSFDTSSISLGNNTKLEAGTLTLDDNSAMTINSGASATAQLVEVAGDSTLAGTGSGEGLIADSFDLQANNTFSQGRSRVEVSGSFFFYSGSVLNIDDSYFSAHQIFGRGGTVNITNGGEFVLTDSFWHTSRQATFNTDATSQFTVGQNADFKLGPMLSVNNSGYFNVLGYLSGTGTISGTGTTTVYETGQISPGLFYWASSPGDFIGTITFENTFLFRNSSILLYPHSSYRAHLDVVGGVESNDLLQYVDNDFDMTNLHQIRVDLASTKTADELDGKSFTLIAAQNAGATGNLITGGSYPNIHEGGNIPALVDFTISNNNTNGHDDLTLNATKQGAVSIHKHPSVTKEHRQGTTANSVVNPNTGQTTTTVVTVTPTQPGSVSTTAPSITDPISGNTISTSVAVVPTSGGTLSQTVTTTVTSPSNSVLGQHTATTPLTVPTDSGTAHQTITTVVTSPTGTLLANNSSTTKLVKATGTDNKLAGASLIVNAANAGNTTIQNQLNTLQNDHVARHIDSIHAEPYSSNLTISLEQNDLFLNMTLNNASPQNPHSYSANQVEVDTDTDKRFWIDSGYVRGEVEGQSDLGNFEYSLYNFMVGKDLKQTSDSNLGVFFGVGTQKMDEHDLTNQDFSATSYHLGMYGYKRLKDWRLTMATGYGYGDQNGDRQVQLGTTLSGVNSAKFKSDSFYIGANGRYKPIINYKWVTVSPGISMLYNYYYQEGFTETGVDSLALTVGSTDAQSFITGVGLDGVFEPFGKSRNIYPIAFVRYEKDWWANDVSSHMIAAALSTNPDYQQNFAGQNRGDDIWTLGIGLKSKVASQWQVSGGLIQGWDSNGNEYAAGISAEYEF